MIKMRFILTPFMLAVLIIGITIADERPTKKPCKDHPKLSGPCFKIRGRMSLFNGSHLVRIWPIGTNRMLAIGDGDYLLKDYENLPRDIERQLNWEKAMYADFTVCPFTEDKPGAMRLICVESAENILVREFK